MSAAHSKRRGRRLAIAGISAVLVLGLTACGDDDPADPGSSAGQTSAAGPDSGGITAPGAQLAYGESATVERTTAQGGKYTVQITVSEPVEGTAEDLTTISELEDYEYQPDQKPYFVDYTVTYVAIDAQATGNLGSEIYLPERLLLDALDANGTYISGSSRVGFAGDNAFDKCTVAQLPDVVTAGTTIDSCTTFVMYTKQPLESIRLAEHGTPYAGPEEDAPGEPVVWS